MRKSLLPIGVLLLIVAWPSEVLPQGRGSRQTVYVDYVDPPPTFEALWDSAKAVVRAQVIGVGPPFLNQFKSVERVHRLRVIELFKGPESFPNVFGLRQYGGTVKANAVEISTPYPGDLLLEQGAEALLFLDQGEETGVFRAAFGPAGLFEIRTVRDASQPINWAQVRVPLAAQTMADLNGINTVRLQDLLHKMRGYRGYRGNR